MVLLNRQDGALFESAIAKRGTPMMGREVQHPVIRSGDRLVVEESSAVVEARLEAVALGPAAEGAEFRVRLAIGGKVVLAVALGPGHAAFADPAGKR
jgi:flagella basal body P-ring formation protein FlgA